MSQKAVFVRYRRTQDVINLAFGHLANNEKSFGNYLPRTVGLLQARPPHTGKQCSVIVLKVSVRVFCESEKKIKLKKSGCPSLYLLCLKSQLFPLCILSLLNSVATVCIERLGQLKVTMVCMYRAARPAEKLKSSPPV